ncbi:MAG: hypothetical protein GDYSWBUE_002070 [Candidatus Fervidibacterota bacterium]
MSLRHEELAAMLHQMAAAFQSGMTAHEALKMLEESSSSKRRRSIYHELAARCASGMSLSEAMAAMPRAFPRWLIGIVRAGERTGRLANMLRFAAEQCDSEAAWQRRWRWSRLYLSICIILLPFVMPLPRMLLNGFQWYASLVLKCILPALLLAYGAVLVWRAIVRHRAIDELIRQLLSVMPMFGGTITHSCIANFLLSTAQAIDAGMSAADAIEVGFEAMDVVKLRAKAAGAKRAVSEGATISDALSNSGLLNRSEASIIQVGERTGTIVQALMRVAEERRRRVASLRWASLILKFAIVYLAMAIAIVFCIYSLYQALFEWVEREFEAQ